MAPSKTISRLLGSYRNKAEDSELINLSVKQLDNPFNFYNLLQSPSFHSWLRQHNLLAKVMVCDKCNAPCVLNKRKDCINGESFRCNKNRKHEISVRRGSFF